MRTPEEMAREVVEDYDRGALELGDIADVIRARDAEVAEQVRAEFEDMEHRLSVLLCNLTGGLLSKTGYDVATMEQHIEDYFEREVVEPARAEVRAETLAGFTEERAKFWEHDEGAGRLRRATTGVVCTRLVGPWEPVEP